MVWLSGGSVAGRVRTWMRTSLPVETYPPTKIGTANPVVIFKEPDTRKAACETLEAVQASVSVSCSPSGGRLASPNLTTQTLPLFEFREG